MATLVFENSQADVSDGAIIAMPIVKAMAHEKYFWSAARAVFFLLLCIFKLELARRLMPVVTPQSFTNGRFAKVIGRLRSYRYRVETILQ